MTLGERIRACRHRAGMSQEKVAQLTGVSRQAVTKWESGQSAPNTENLFRLAEIFGTTVDLLLAPEDGIQQSPAEEMYRLCRREERKAALGRQRRRQNLRTALLVAAGYLAVYLAGRILWCDRSRSTLVGWLWTVKPSGPHSYLYGWLLSSRLFWCAMALSVLPALFGKRRLSAVTLAGFVLGLAAGMLFGPYPAGAAAGHGHYGWAIWGAVYLISIAAGGLAQRYGKAPEQGGGAEHPTAP